MSTGFYKKFSLSRKTGGLFILPSCKVFWKNKQRNKNIMHDIDREFIFLFTACWKEGKPCPALHRIKVADVLSASALHLFTSVIIPTRSLLWWYQGGGSFAF